MTTTEAKENVIKNYREHRKTATGLDTEIFLRNAMEQLEEVVQNTIIRRAVKIIEEYEVPKQPLCEQNTLLFAIKSRIKSN